MKTLLAIYQNKTKVSQKFVKSPTKNEQVTGLIIRKGKLYCAQGI